MCSSDLFSSNIPTGFFFVSSFSLLQTYHFIDITAKDEFFLKYIFFNVFIFIYLFLYVLGGQNLLQTYHFIDITA